MDFKPNDLRIGNFVYQGAEIPTQVTEEMIFNFAKNTIVLKPVPLTEEWLSGICYEVVPGYDYGFKQFIHTICRATKDPNCWWRLYGRWGNAIGDQIEYVHQLQNLFFALYRTELVLTSAQAKSLN